MVRKTPGHLKRARIEVRGRVQGVGFRHACRREALALGLTGWVRNRPDGSVEIVAEGDAAALASLVAWCRRGPLWARVEDVAVVSEPPCGDCRDFAVRG
jgi:acylphosphatase